MKTSKIIAAAALTILAAAGAQAETYDGVHALTNQFSRAEVSSQAVATARSGYVGGEAGAPIVAQAYQAPRDRADVRAEAVVKSHNTLSTLDSRAFYNSVVPAQYTKGSLAIRRQQRSQQQAAL